MNNSNDRINRRAALTVLIALVIAGRRMDALASPATDAELEFRAGKRVCYWRNGRKYCRTVYR